MPFSYLRYALLQTMNGFVPIEHAESVFLGSFADNVRNCLSAGILYRLAVYDECSYPCFLLHLYIQNRLDEVCGPENWYNEFKPWHSNGKKDSQLCGIAIHFEGKGFITKWDGAEDSDIEPIKGGLSDSMKRAAYQWGIGRVLYSLDTVWVDIERRGKSYVIKDSERRKLDNAYLSTLESLGLEPAKACGIQSLLTPKTASEQNTANDKVPPITHGQEPQQAKSGSAQPAPRAQEHPAQSPAAPAQTQRTQPPAQDRSDGQGGKTVSFGGATQIAPAIELYTVLGAKVQGGMSGSNTLVNLETPEKKQLYAYVRGARPELVSGVQLSHVKLTTRKQDTVIFYVLETYEVFRSEQQAA